jgi:hypothetical protein
MVEPMVEERKGLQEQERDVVIGSWNSLRAFSPLIHCTVHTVGVKIPVMFSAESYF